MKTFYISITSSIDLSLSASVWIDAKSKKEAIQKFKKEYDDFDIKYLLKENLTVEDIENFDCSIAEVKNINKPTNINFIKLVNAFEDFNYYDD